MFAGYGMFGNIIDKVKFGYNMKLGNSTSKFKLYCQKGPIYVDTKVDGMFAFPILDKLDLKNVDVSQRTSLSRMFEFCIMPAALNDESENPDPVLDIST